MLFSFSVDILQDADGAKVASKRFRSRHLKVQRKDAIELGQKVLEIQQIVPRASRRSGQCKSLGVPITSGDDLNVGAMQGPGAFAPLPM